MIKLISPYTGANTYIADNRLQEYLDAGYRIAVQEAKAEPEKPAKPKKRTSKK